MFEQDYIMRVIKEMVRMLLKLLFHIDTESPTAEVLKGAEQKETLESLLDMVDEGNINEAENRVWELISEKSPDALEVALLFYSCLNDKTDDFLAEHDFQREEIKEGLDRLASEYGLGSLASVFLEDI